MTQTVVLVLETAGSAGTERYCKNLADYLREQSVHPIFAFAQHSERGEFFKDEDCHDCSDGPAAVLKLSQSVNAAAVHLHLYSSLYPIAKQLRKCEIPIVCTLHLPYRQWNFIHRCRIRRALKHCSTIFGVSRAVLEGLQNPPLNLSTKPMPGPLHDDWFTNEWEPTFNLREKKEIQVAGVGRLAYQKNWETLLEAATILKSRGYDPAIELCGDGPLEAALRKNANANDLNVNFHGRLKQESLMDVLSSSNCAVLPSRFEGLPLSAIETMAFGLPTICATFSSARELVSDGHNGLLFEQGSAEALADQIERLSENHELAKALSRNGRQHCQMEFTSEVLFPPILEAYKITSQR